MPHHFRFALIALIVVNVSAIAHAMWSAPTPSLPRALCVTHGLDEESGFWSRVDDPEYRSVAAGSDGNAASLSFTARGETSPVVPLASGKVRHQVCLKLRAVNGCNVVYACWRLEPTPWIQVQSKINPGKGDSSECGAFGYVQEIATWSAAVPSYRDGKPHALAAAIEPGGITTQVSVDGAVVWVGSVSGQSSQGVGLAGVRSDNERWTGVLSADVDCSSVVGAD